MVNNDAEWVQVQRELERLQAEVKKLKDRSAHHDKGLALTQRMVNLVFAKLGLKDRIDV